MTKIYNLHERLLETLEQSKKEEKKKKKTRGEQDGRGSPLRFLPEQKMWIKYEWMKEVWKVQLRCALQRAGRRIRSCSRALSADVCQAVPHEAPPWAEMLLLLVHYGWGVILRHWGGCVLIFFFFFEQNEMTPIVSVKPWGFELFWIVWRHAGTEHVPAQTWPRFETSRSKQTDHDAIKMTSSVTKRHFKW